MAGRHVALIRGINVGRAKRVAMADLRTIVENLGYGDVRTLLNSGNVVFTANAAPRTAADRIEKALSKKLGISARITVLDAAEVAAIVTENPLREVAKDPTRLLVAVLINPADRPRIVPLMKQDWGTDVVAIGTRVAYMWCPEGILESRLAEAVGKVLGDAVTTRNWATMTKLHALTEDQR